MEGGARDMDKCGLEGTIELLHLPLAVFRMNCVKVRGPEQEVVGTVVLENARLFLESKQLCFFQSNFYFRIFLKKL